MPGLRHAAMLEVNEFLVLDFVRDRAQTTRPEIARALGLSASSVSRIVARLIRGGLIVESAGSPEAPGRPRARIAFNRGAGAVIGVDLGGTKCHAALADLGGGVLHEVRRPTHAGGEPYATLLRAIREMEAEARRRGLPVLAIAVGVPAILDPDTGTAVSGPNVHWQGFAIVPRLAADVGAPVTVENDVNLAALAHAWRGDARQVNDFVTISIGTGIGAAVVANGRLVKGHRNGAGEIGYLALSADALRRGLRDGIGDFEERASGPGIARRATELLETTRDASALRGVEVTPAAIFQAATHGDPIAGRVIEETLDHVALALVAIGATLDPELIVIDGSVGRSLQPWLGALAERVAGRLWSAPRIVISSLAPDSTVIGAIAAALQSVRRQAAPASLFGVFDIGADAQERGFEAAAASAAGT